MNLLKAQFDAAKGALAEDEKDKKDPAADAACIGCVERVFGADYRPCSCCIRPILEEMVRYQLLYPPHQAHTLTC